VYGTPGAPSYVPPSASTAKTLIFVGLILQALFVLIGIVVGLASLLFFFIGVVYLAFAALGLLWLILVWMFSYTPVRAGRYEAAKTPTLIFAILSIITLFGILPGILYLIAYIKLGDAVREQQMPPAGYPGGAPMMAPQSPYAGQPMQPMQPMQPQPMQQPMQPMSAPPMAPPPTTTPTAAVICPRCGKPATFVPQYNRYYCYTDQQYV
jgi:hypothetical protein